MNRRDYLAGLGSVSLIGLSGCVESIKQKAEGGLGGLERNKPSLNQINVEGKWTQRGANIYNTYSALNITEPPAPEQVEHKWTQTIKNVNQLIFAEETIYVLGEVRISAIRIDGTQLWTVKNSDDVQFMNTMTIHNSSIYVSDEEQTLYRIDEGEITWSVNPGNNDSFLSPSVYNDVLFIPTEEGKLFALSSSTGRIYWKRELGNPITVVPAYHYGYVYVLTESTDSDDGEIFAISADEGNTRWRTTLQGTSLQDPAISPENNVVLSCRQIDGSSVLTGFNIQTGEIEWNRTIDYNDVIYSLTNGHVFVRTSNNSISAYNISDGTRVWKRSTVGKPRDIQATSVAIYYRGTDGIQAIHGIEEAENDVYFPNMNHPSVGDTIIVLSNSFISATENSVSLHTG